MTDATRAGVAVVGTDHFHVAELTARLAAAGAEVRVVVATDDRIGPWLASQYPDARGDDPHGDDVDVVVTAAVPDSRAGIAAAALAHGKDVVCDKPICTTGEQLVQLRTVQHSTGRRLLAVFGERLGSPAMCEALALVRSGRIGHVVHTVGLGPHTLDLAHRPPWFFDPARYGGILGDIGTHQVDAFLAFTGATDADVVTAGVRSHPEHDGVQILGEMLLRAPDGRTGYARVDYLTPAGLGAWGDVRFTVVGTAGTIEVRPMNETVDVVDGERRERIECAGRPVEWAEAFLRGEMPVAQEHAFTVHDVCLRAQRAAQSAAQSAAK